MDLQGQALKDIDLEPQPGWMFQVEHVVGFGEEVGHEGIIYLLEYCGLANLSIIKVWEF